MKTVSSLSEANLPTLERAWYRALSLTERIASLRAAGEHLIASQEDQARAAKRLEQWKKQLVFHDPERFAERLALDSITEQELLLLLAEPVEHLQKRMATQVEPAWLAELQQIWDRSPNSSSSLNASEQSDTLQAPTSFDVLQPLIETGNKRLQQGIQHLQNTAQTCPFDAAALHSLFLANLAPRLSQMVIRTFVLEMHIARLEERLVGDTPQERFTNFMRQLCQPERLHALLSEYPLLARSIVTIVQHWADYSLEIAQRLCADWSDICRSFAHGTELGSLVEISSGAGDTHRSGRSVAILRFSSGHRLVYKPRSLALDQHFQDLLTWVNTLGIAQPLRITTILDKGSHGWAEFVQAQSCLTEADISHFYERQGSYLALLYALDATDFHFENILAASEHPILVDLEALFHPRLRESEPEITSVATESIDNSVLRTGLLPSRIHIAENGVGLDISGLGGQAGQLTLRPVPVWKEGGTDQMHMMRERLEMATGENRPTLLEKNVEVAHYTSAILKGFTEMYQLLLAHQEEWLTQILPRFAQDEVRVILRATRTYATLLAESFHPERLQDGLERERLFDNLWDGVAQSPYLRQVIASERQDLLQGDVPLFTTHPSSRDLFTSRGERIADFCSEPSIECSKRRIQQMNSGDLARQQWIIQASLATTITGDKHLPMVPLPASSRLEVTPEELLQAATSIGERLGELAISQKGEASWLGVHALAEHEGTTIWQVTTTGPTLYDGLPGIILFLSYLGKLIGTSEPINLADEALLTLRKQISLNKSLNIPQRIGVFNGLGSLIYLFTHLAVLRQDTSYIHLAEELVEDLDPLVAQDQLFGISDGSAGCIAGLLALQAVAPSSQTLATAIRCGEHLLSNARPLANGLGWPIQGQEAALAGFSHGAAGIALSLFKLAEVSKQERFQQAALAALEYERSLFSAEQGNWIRFLRPGEQGFSVTWSHGAPGIGLARLLSLPYVDDSQIYQEIHIALATTLKQGFGHNQSLCHGDLGNLETILMATQLLDKPNYRKQLKRLTAQIFSGIQEHGWVTGVPLGVETPGLMTGLAGIGYELLRLARPEQVSSVLSISPPIHLES